MNTHLTVRRKIPKNREWEPVSAPGRCPVNAEGRGESGAGRAAGGKSTASRAEHHAQHTGEAQQTAGEADEDTGTQKTNPTPRVFLSGNCTRSGTWDVSRRSENLGKKLASANSQHEFTLRKTKVRSSALRQGQLLHL